MEKLAHNASHHSTAKQVYVAAAQIVDGGAVAAQTIGGSRLDTSWRFNASSKSPSAANLSVMRAPELSSAAASRSIDRHRKTTHHSVSHAPHSQANTHGGTRARD